MKLGSYLTFVILGSGILHRSSFCVLAAVLFLSACSQTQLHIVNQGYSEKHISSVVAQLSKLNVNVVKSDVTIPEAFSATVIATNPNFTDINLLNKIESILLASDFSAPQQLSFAQGRHFYSENHLGLYLRNEKNVQPTMPAYLRTQYCKFADATIMFSSDGKFILEFEKSAYEDKLVVVKGHYSFDSTNLQLVTEDKISQLYVFSKEMKQTHLGERPADVFKPTKLTAKVGALNCEFLIIYMD